MDLRKRRSQEKLQIALAQHLQSQTIDEITIGELTQTAGVSRQTFYSNFDSKQSILLNRIETIFEKSWMKSEALMQQSDIGREEFVEICIRNLLEECDRDRVLMRAAFTGQAGIQCLSLLKKLVSKMTAERILFQFNHNFDAHQLDTISDFYRRRQHYIAFPILMNATLFKNQPINGILNLGLNVSFRLSDTETIEDDAPKTRTYYQEKTENVVDYGLIIGGGFNIDLKNNQSLQFELRYYQGLSDMFEPNDEFDVVQHQVLSLNVLYFFHIKKYD